MSRALPPGLGEHPFSVRQGEAAGLSRGRMRGHDLARPFRGARVVRSVRPTLLERCAAYACRCPPGHFFSHVTAALLWNVPLPRELERGGALEVAVLKPGAMPRSAGIRGHRLAGDGIRVVKRHGLDVADPASLWCQLARVLSHDDLVAAGDHLVLVPARPDPADPRPYVELSELQRRVAAFRGRGAPALRRAMAAVRQGAESRAETHLRLAIVRAGLPEPELQGEIRNARGRFLGRADMVYRFQRVIVEYNGDHHRTDPQQFEDDLVRIESFRDDGWTVVEVRKRGLYVTLSATLARIRRALAF
ncbi:hypothetical protein VD659_16000 [Herbiconiux sp. 11R-BC]|uniref:hypothetical protein n=1 Tax=Herbiconiux sp. 11R-BC TaxID=3111637 RepID=UPI003C08D2B8